MHSGHCCSHVLMANLDIPCANKKLVVCLHTAWEIEEGVVIYTKQYSAQVGLFSRWVLVAYLGCCE